MELKNVDAEKIPVEQLSKVCNHDVFSMMVQNYKYGIGSVGCVLTTNLVLQTCVSAMKESVPNVSS